MRTIVTTTLILVGIIHLLPSAGVLGPDRLAALYGIAVDEPNLAILMRHRAVLFGILGLFFVVAARIRKLQAPAFAAGFVSVGSFLALAWTAETYNAQIGRVVMVDVVALVLLLLGLAAYGYDRRGSTDIS